MLVLETGSLFGGIFVPEDMRLATGGRAWISAMIEAEVSLSVAQARMGVIPEEAARGIRAAGLRLAGDLDPEELARSGRASGNPVPPLVVALTAAAPECASGYVHRGATSQDILDSAAMIVCRNALDLILTDLDRLAAGCADLARTHRDTVMAGRTLMQQALPVTFGLKAAGWLDAVVEATGRLRSLRREGLAAQLGGATGTLASLGDLGPETLREFSRELGLAEPTVPWHANRLRISETGGVLALVSGVAGKVARDIILLSQTEVREVSEAAGEGRGGSSTLPHKRNPVLSVAAVASARRAQTFASALLGAMDHEHERAAGAWHTEWENLSGALASTGGAVAGVREAVEGLEVYPDAMRANLDLTRGMLLSENLTTLAAEKLGRLEAHERVTRACKRVMESGRDLASEVLADPALGEALSGEDVRAALRPENYLGSAGVFVDRALQRYEKNSQER